MGYATINIPDAKIEVLDEKTLDDKFKPEATLKTFFLVDKSEHVAKTGELNGGIAKLIRSWKPGNTFGSKNILVLAYVKSDRIQKFVDIQKSQLHAIHELTMYDPDAFYECKQCGGFIKGKPEEKESGMTILGATPDITDYNCIRCGATLATYKISL
jgi:DNA-directed RNA polymerase subunit RPC12/RpoP